MTKPINRLRKWFARKPAPMTKSAFAEAIGCTPSYVSQLLWDDPPWPGRDVSRRIGEVTKGYVTPNILAGYVAAHKPRKAKRLAMEAAAAAAQQSEAA